MMKSIALVCVLLVVAVSAKRDTSKISLLKQKVVGSSQQFAYDGFKDSTTGTMSIKVNVGHPQTVTLTKEQQQPQWSDVNFVSPLKAKGYNKWMSVNGGMVFKNEKSEMVECAMAGTNPLDDGKVVLDYHCKPMDKARFSKVKSTYWIQGAQAATPSGWDTRWGPFDYPFYTTTSQGILGCKNTSGGYCTPQHADLFPFESCYSNINDAGEAKLECEKKKKEKQEKLDFLEKEVEQQEKDKAEETAKFFGHNFNDAESEGMHLEKKVHAEEIKEQQQEK